MIPPEEKLDSPSAASASAGYGLLARRIAGQTSNLLAAALIITAGIALGRQVLLWWTPQAVPPPAAIPQPVAADPHAPLLFEFGDWPVTMQRSSVEGDVQAALAQLRFSSKALAASADHSGPPRPAESRLLKRLAKEQPKDSWQTAGTNFALFELTEPLPMVVVVRQTGQESATAAAQRRMVSWGVAFPTSAGLKNEGADSWSLFACAVRPTAGAQDLWQLPFSLPSQAHRTLSLQTIEGGRLMGVAGAGTIEDWQVWIDKNSDLETPLTWANTLTGRQGETNLATGGRLEIQLQQQQSGVRGLILFSPVVEQLEQSE